jgi:HEAT repeat protein
MNALQGLLTYEQWVARGHGEDAALLEPVAIAVLRDIAQGPRNELHVDALRALVAAKASGAREALDQEAKKKSDAQTVADLDAAKSGDQAAVKRLTDQAASAAASASLAQALAGLGVSAGEPGLLLMAQGRDPQARAAAAEALGNIASEASRATLASLQRDADPAARIAATVSLAQLGDTAALATVDRMLASNAPDTQIAATRAFGGRPGPWVEIIRPLLENPDGLTRIDAARAIAPVDPEAARRTLTSALGNANPVVRYESAHAIERTPGLRLTGEDVSALRARLRDTDPATRLAAAAALLRAARENG